MKTLLCLLLTVCSGCAGSPFLDSGVNVYQIKNNDRAEIRSAMRYLEAQVSHRVSFVENASTDAPDLVIRDDDSKCEPSQNASTWYGRTYWIDITFCPSHWSSEYINKDVVYLHELGHALGLGHTKDTDCVMNESSKAVMAFCPKEKQLLIDILDGKVKPDATRDF